MSLWADYKKEREGKEILEKEDGFAIYSWTQDGGCYIEDIYVKPDKRKSGLAREMADQIKIIAKERECKFILGSVLCGANGDTDSLKVLLSYGMKLWEVHGNLIIFGQEI